VEHYGPGKLGSKARATSSSGLPTSLYCTRPGKTSELTCTGSAPPPTFHLPPPPPHLESGFSSWSSASNAFAGLTSFFFPRSAGGFFPSNPFTPPLRCTAGGASSGLFARPCYQSPEPSRCQATTPFSIRPCMMDSHRALKESRLRMDALPGGR
jgi:hypothetical protein